MASKNYKATETPSVSSRDNQKLTYTPSNGRLTIERGNSVDLGLSGFGGNEYPIDFRRYPNDVTIMNEKDRKSIIRNILSIARFTLIQGSNSENTTTEGQKFTNNSFDLDFIDTIVHKIKEGLYLDLVISGHYVDDNSYKYTYIPYIRVENISSSQEVIYSTYKMKINSSYEYEVTAPYKGVNFTIKLRNISLRMVNYFKDNVRKYPR